MNKYAPYVLIEVTKVADRPKAICFTFESEDGTKLTPQQLLDAFAEYLLMADPEIIFAKASAGDMH